MMQPPEGLEYVGEIEASAEDSESIIDQLWHDRALQTILVATLLINVGLLAYLLIRFDALPDPLPLHFDAAGLPDRIEAKNGIMALPMIGLVVLALNTVLGILAYRRERAASLFLAVSALIVQLLMWLAAINIAGGIL